MCSTREHIHDRQERRDEDDLASSAWSLEQDHCQTVKEPSFSIQIRVR